MLSSIIAKQKCLSEFKRKAFICLQRPMKGEPMWALHSLGQKLQKNNSNETCSSTSFISAEAFVEYRKLLHAPMNQNAVHEKLF